MTHLRMPSFERRARWAGCATVAAVLLGGCWAQSPPQTSELAAELNKDDAEDRYDAIKEIENRAEAMDDAAAALVVPALREALRDDDPRIRYRAAKALAKLNAAAALAVPELTKTLGDEDPQTRYYSAKALAKIGRPARTAVPQLARALSDENDDVKYYAAKALGAIGQDAKSAAEELAVVAGQSSNPKVKEAAQKALEKINAN